jgi:N-acetylmuramoyl-L-alanine amidase
VIDPGHGGHDSGTRGHGLIEKNVALDISLKLYALLKNAGVNAVLTRSDDRFLELPDRPAIANRLNADAFVAVHLNSTGSVRNVWSGTETYYHFQDPVCKELAQMVQAQLVLAIGLPDRGARSDSIIYRRLGFSVLRNSQVPAILVEVGYLNHPYDASRLKDADFRERAAEGIMAGLRAFFDRYQRSAKGR